MRCGKDPLYPERHSRAQAEVKAESLAPLLAAIVALVDERIAHALTKKEGDPYSTTSLPPGVDRRAFHARCRDLASAGDARVWKIAPNSRGWLAKRDVFDAHTMPMTTTPANGNAAGFVEWSVEAAIGSTTRRTR